MTDRPAWTYLPGALALGLLAASVTFPATAHAGCVWAGIAKPDWTYPASGDEDVPLDADLMILGAASDYTAFLDGEPLEPHPANEQVDRLFRDWFLFDMGELEPHSAHEVTLLVKSPDDGQTLEWSMQFETGDAPARTSDEPLALDAVDVEEDFQDSFPCEAGTYSGMCFDVYPIDLVRLSAEPPEGTKLWLVRTTAPDGTPSATPFPAECGQPAMLTYYTRVLTHSFHEMLDPGATPLRFTLQAIDAAGNILESNAMDGPERPLLDLRERDDGDPAEAEGPVRREDADAGADETRREPARGEDDDATEEEPTAGSGGCQSGPRQPGALPWLVLACLVAWRRVTARRSSAAPR